MPLTLGLSVGYNKRSSRSGCIFREVAGPVSVKPEDKPGDASALGVEDGKDLEGRVRPRSSVWDTYGSSAKSYVWGLGWQKGSCWLALRADRSFQMHCVGPGGGGHGVC